MDGKHPNNLDREKLQALITKRILLKLHESEEADNTHPYLQDHGIESHDLSVDKKGNLLAVGVDLEASFINKEYGYIPQAKTMMTIAPTGKTKVEKWSTSTGAAIMIGHQEFRHIVKTPDQEAHEVFIFITDNYPNGAFIHENLGWPVAVALRLSNVKSITEIFREKFPKAKVVVLLNNDPEVYSKSKYSSKYSKVEKDCKEVGAIVLHSLFVQRKAANDLFSNTGDDLFACNCRALIVNPDIVINNILERIKVEIGLLETADAWPLHANCSSEVLYE